MDATTFDRLATAIARGRTRRTTLRLLAGGLLGGLLTQRGLSPTVAAPGDDRDGDGLFDDDETGGYGTDPDQPDTDGDGASDGEEVYYETDPLAASDRPQRTDTDGDGLYDDDEERLYGTDPTKPDTDGDGVDDGEEVYNGTDPAQLTCPAGTSPCGDRCAGGEGAPCHIGDLEFCCSGTCDYLVGGRENGGTCASCNGPQCSGDDACCPGTKCVSGFCGDCRHRAVVCTPGAQRCCNSDCTDQGGGTVCLSNAGGRCKHDVDCANCYFNLDECSNACVNGVCQF